MAVGGLHRVSNKRTEILTMINGAGVTLVGLMEKLVEILMEPNQ